MSVTYNCGRKNQQYLNPCRKSGIGRTRGVRGKPSELITSSQSGRDQGAGRAATLTALLSFWASKIFA